MDTKVCNVLYAESFMFLDFEFDPLPMSLKHVSMVLMAVVLGSLLVPGLVLVNKNKNINGGLICLHAVGMTVIELQLHCQFKGIYDSYLVIFSSAVSYPFQPQGLLFEFLSRAIADRLEYGWLTTCTRRDACPSSLHGCWAPFMWES